MKKYVIEFYEVPHGGGIFSYPNELFRKEFIVAKDEDEITKFVTSQKDQYGEVFKDRPLNGFGLDFRYITTNSVVKVRKYKEPKFSKIK